MNQAPRQQLESVSRRAGLVGGVALLILLLIGLFAPRAALGGYLCAFFIVFAAPLAGAALLMLHHLVGGRWGWSVRRPLEAMSASLPALIPFFIPIFLGVSRLYPWVNPSTLVADDALRHKQIYLNSTFFWWRTAAYLVVWAIGGWVLSRWSRSQDRADQGRPPLGLKAFSAFGLIVYSFSVSFAGMDWFASLDPDWYSTVYGMYLIAGQTLTALVVLAFALTWLGRADLDGALIGEPPAAASIAEVRRAALPDRWHDIGNLLLTFVVLHTYCAYSQFFIIWNGNLPDANVWYWPRMHGFWSGLGVLMLVLDFGLPFGVLLFRLTKRTARTLAAIAGLILLGRIADALWMVLPSLRDQSPAATIPLAILAMIGLGGLWLALTLRLWLRGSLWPVHDPLLEAAHA